jgi:serine O-acetyltransferase
MEGEFQKLRQDIAAILEETPKLDERLMRMVDVSLLLIVKHRITSAWRKTRFDIKVLRVLWEKFFEFLTHSHIASAAEIGGGLRIFHGWGIFINAGVTIGKNCILYHRVTIGARFPGDECPTIGDNVTIGSGACVVGPVIVPDNARIGANAVVTPKTVHLLKIG